MASGFSIGHRGPSAHRGRRVSSSPRRPGMSVPRPCLRTRGQQGRRSSTVNRTLTEEAWGDEDTWKIATGVWGAEKGPHSRWPNAFFISHKICYLSACSAKLNLREQNCPKPGNWLLLLKCNEDIITSFPPQQIRCCYYSAEMVAFTSLKIRFHITLCTVWCFMNSRTKIYRTFLHGFQMPHRCFWEQPKQQLTLTRWSCFSTVLCHPVTHEQVVLSGWHNLWIPSDGNPAVFELQCQSSTHFPLLSGTQQASNIMD